MIAHSSRDADATRRALGLEPGRHIHRVPVEISPVGNHVTDVNADTKADGPIGGMVAVIGRYRLLHLHGTAHRPIDAIEQDEQGVASGLNDSAAMLIDRRVYQSATESPQSFERFSIIQRNQAAVTDHIRIDHGD